MAPCSAVEVVDVVENVCLLSFVTYVFNNIFCNTTSQGILYRPPSLAPPSSPSAVDESMAQLLPPFSSALCLALGMQFLCDVRDVVLDSTKSGMIQVS